MSAASHTISQQNSGSAPEPRVTPSRVKLDLLAKYLNGEVNPEPASLISRRAPDTVLQLSLSQERLWFLDQLMPGSPVFNVPISVRFSRPVDMAILRRSIDEIVCRHEILRTTFAAIDGRPELVVLSQVDVPLEVIDLTSFEAKERAEKARHVAQAEAVRSFDLSRGPLIRTSLIKLSATDSLFLLTFHHIVSDGHSVLIFFRELVATYRTFATGQPAPLADLPIQYSDYALWQRGSLQNEFESQLVYWKEKLSGDLPVLEIPADRSRPAVQTHCGSRVTLTLSEQTTQSLVALSQREGATLFMTLAAAFKILLHRYTGQDDIIIGSPIANRPRRETEDLIGFFLNNLALRTDVSGDPTFRELLARVRETALEAYSNQDVPFEKLIEELKPPRDLGRTPIFQAYFNLFSISDRIDLPDGEAITLVDAWLQSEETPAKFDLTLYAGVAETEIKLALVYNTDLYDRERMAEMLMQLQTLLSQIVEQPDKKISCLSLVTSGAKHYLPDPTYPLAQNHYQAITQVISDQARQRSHEIAVLDSYESWTYGELDRRSNRIANCLLANGIAKGDVVAIYAHRSASLVAAVLGVLKAGAGFMILDPAYPAARLIDCLKIATPRAFIQIDAAGPLPADLDEFIETLDLCYRDRLPSGERGRPDPHSNENPNVDIGPDDLAYIAFTSGSTGQPKAVMGRHGPLTLFTSWAIDKFGLNESDRFCMLSGLAHDPLHRDIFTPLQLGGTICIPDAKDLEAPDRLRAWLKEQNITVANLTPAMSQLLTDGATAGDQIDSLRYSFFVGDALTRANISRLRKLAQSIQCINLYGSTETQRAVGYYVADGDLRDAREIVPLGKGIRDTQLLVLSRQQRLCGMGELGEVYVRSPHLAAGYLGDEQMTRQRFIVNPFTNSPHDRLYRTGDLGRYLPDGNVEHVGRADRQVKIRGFRIEPAEIEAALTKHPQVSEAVVIPLSLESRLPAALVAYIVPVRDKEITADVLRECLSAKLPVYMIPSAFVFIDALPLTPNGKLDRRALPAPDQIHQQRDGQNSAKLSGAEQALIEIWQETIGIDHVNVDDNFFELGGHSLLAVRLFARIEKEFGRRLPLAELFQSPTVAQLAVTIDRDSAASCSSIVPIQTRGTRPPFFCVHAVGGNVLEYYELARTLGPDQPFYGLQSLGLVRAHEQHARIEDMAAHYIKEIRNVQPVGPYFIGGRSLGGIIAYEMARQLKASGDEVALLALLDSYPVGHHKLLPPAGDSGRVNRGWRRIKSHFANMRSLPLAAKIRYVLTKSGFVPQRTMNAGWRAIYRSCEKLGIEIPRALRSVEQLNWLAAHRFVPRLYDGSLTLFWASRDLRAKFDQLEGWQKLAPGGLKVREIPGTHLDMIKEPHVFELAKQLNECLLRAQAL